MDVTLILTGEEDRQAVINMFTAYFYDLAQYDENIIINDYGLPTWAPAGLPGPRTHEECVQSHWWVRDRCEVYLIRADESPAGFVIICREPRFLPDGVEVELMDFYITPKYRRQGVGRRAARAAFDLYQGMWVVYQLELNLPARAFWQKVIAEYTGGHYINLDGGTQQRFQN